MAKEDKRQYSRKAFLPDGTLQDIRDGSLQRIADAMEMILPGLNRGFDRLTAATAQATAAFDKLNEQLAASRADVERLRSANKRAARTIQRLRKDKNV